MADKDLPKLPGEQEDDQGGGISRREFVKGAAIGAAGMAVLGGGLGYAMWPKGETPAGPTTPLPSSPTTPAATPGSETQLVGWGKLSLPYPTGHFYVECDEMKCVGCGICEWACSMHHYGVMNKELSRIRVQKRLLPLPKGIQNTCCHCEEEERECQKACNIEGAMYWDEETQHMVIVEDKCTGCMACVDACPAGNIHTYEAQLEIPFMCDLCDDGNGNRDPQCVAVCPHQALNVQNPNPYFRWRFSMDEKAELVAHRMYPLPKDRMFVEEV